MDNQQFGHELQTVDHSVLTPIVRRALGRDTLTIDHWRSQPLTESSTSGAGVYRFSGTGNDAGEAVSWSVILKCITRETDKADLASLLYWKREFLVYQSGLLNSLTPGLAAPQCFHNNDTSDTCWLWLEDIAVGDNRPWSLSDFGVAATHFGRWNGSYLVERTLPSHPWLVKGLLRQRAHRVANSGLFADLPRFQQHPLVQRSLPSDIVAAMLDLWASREQFLTALDQLPQTLQHSDAGRKNLFLRWSDAGQAETVAIDWGWLGTAAIGEELAPLVAATPLWFMDVQPEELSELEHIAFAGYLEGLREAGWSEDARLARLGYTASVALRFAPLLGWFELAASDEDGKARLQSFYTHPLDEVADQIAAIRRFALGRAQEARALLQVMDH